MSKYSSLSELLQAYSTKGPGDVINEGVQGVKNGMDIAASREKAKVDFQNKLREHGILQDKNDIDRIEADTKKRHQDVDEIPANATGIPSLAPLGDRNVPSSVLAAQVKSENKPPIRNQSVGPALDANGRPIPGKFLEYVPGTNGEQGHLQTIELPTGVAGAGLKNTPNAPASQVADEGAIQTQTGMLDQAEQMLKALPDGGIVQGAMGMASKLPLVGGTIAPEQKAYEDFKPAFATAVYRAQTGDTRLSDADAAQRAYPMLPSLSDPKPLREQKMQVIRDLFRNRQTTVQQQQGVSRNLPGAGITAPPPPTGAPAGKRTRTLKSGKVVVEED